MAFSGAFSGAFSEHGYELAVPPVPFLDIGPAALDIVASPTIVAQHSLRFLDIESLQLPIQGGITEPLLEVEAKPSVLEVQAYSGGITVILPNQQLKSDTELPTLEVEAKPTKVTRHV